MQYTAQVDAARRSFGLIGRVRASSFLRHNAIFFAGAVTIGALNYLYYPIMGRLLEPSKFGEVQAIFSLFAQITIFLNVLSLLTVNIVANYEDSAKRNRVILELEKLALVVSLGLLLITGISGSVLQHFFNFGSSVPFIFLVLAVVISTPLTFRAGYLRGRQRFGLVSLVGITSSVCDLLFSVIFVLTGWGTPGAVFGLVVAQIAALALAVFAAKQHGLHESLRHRVLRFPDLKLVASELKYALLVLVGSLAITGLYSIDIIVVKHYFDAETAGLYAGMATIARIIFFLTASIAQVLLPTIRLQAAHRVNQQILAKSLLLLIGVGGLTLAVFVIVPRFVIRTLMGSTYLPYASLLPRLSVVVFIISLLNLFILYHMALRRYILMPIVILGVGLTVLLLFFNHQTLTAVIGSLLYGSVGLLAMLALWMVGKKLKSRSLPGGA